MLAIVAYRINTGAAETTGFMYRTSDFTFYQFPEVSAMVASDSARVNES
jgi:hypothetical protein